MNSRRDAVSLAQVNQRDDVMVIQQRSFEFVPGFWLCRVELINTIARSTCSAMRLSSAVASLDSSWNVTNRRLPLTLATGRIVIPASRAFKATRSATDRRNTLFVG